MNTPELEALAARLLAVRSLTAEEHDAVELLAAEMRSAGFDRVWVDEAGSLIGVLDYDRPGPTLLFDGHIDTVGAEPADWARPPFGGQIAAGRLYGRGAADMKGALAAMLHALAVTPRGGLRGRAVLSATVSEEVVEGGALRPVMDAVRPDFVVIGEATGLHLNRAGRGRAEIALTTYGRPAHSSSPQAGRSAVADMIRVIQTLAGLPEPSHPFLGAGSLVLTDIHSEPYPGHSVIPYRCRVTYDRRLLPGETRADVLGALTGLAGLEDIDLRAELVRGDDVTYTGTDLSGEKFFPAWEFSEAHPFVQTALAGLRAAGLNPRLGAYRFCTNAAYSAGTAGVPTVGFGPGREEDAHVLDESIALEELHAAARGYAGILTSVLRA